jgi:hypothetical protein
LPIMYADRANPLRGKVSPRGAIWPLTDNVAVTRTLVSKGSTVKLMNHYFG